MRKAIYLYITVLAVGLFFVSIANAQVPKIDQNAGKRAIIVIDNNFEAQRPTGPIMRRSISCEAWITTDGKLNCKTGVKLLRASIEFKSPTMSSTTPGGNVTSAGGSVSRKLTVKELAIGQNTFTWDISGDKYKETHSITLSIASAFGNGQITLNNKKVPETIKN